MRRMGWGPVHLVVSTRDSLVQHHLLYIFGTSSGVWTWCTLTAPHRRVGSNPSNIGTTRNLWCTFIHQEDQVSFIFLWSTFSKKKQTTIPPFKIRGQKTESYTTKPTQPKKEINTLGERKIKYKTKANQEGNRKDVHQDNTVGELKAFKIRQEGK